ncbi:MAG: anion permease [Clostridiales bacterium]|nr:anion permease [Clostridiales bacterium]
MSSPVVLIMLLMTVTILLTNLINNSAAAVLMAPIAISMANALGVSVDPVLMVVAIGASSAFLTPIGHQSNTLIMGPGGYKFGDYWKMGLPLSLIIIFMGTPLILWIWPICKIMR